MTLMEKYDPNTVEGTWYERWEAAGYFAPRGDGTAFSIAIPPPNVTGTLHMGHAFQHSLVDSIIRRRRMLGDKTLWQMGTDHAGISTQLIVSEQLAREELTPMDIGRDAFIDRAWQWKSESEGTISTQLRRMGASLNWETERFTLDEGLSRAVLEVFIRLYRDGLIYRGKRLVNWDPILETSISDLEVIAEEESGHLWHFRYPLEKEPGQYLVVATTRPETMLGDTAVAVHPDDKRYQHLIGKNIMLPLVNRVIPIIADHYVDQDFGSGCVKITPAHDFNDYEVGQRHQLPMINIMNTDASLNNHTPEPYAGMGRYDARKAIIESMQDLNLLEKTEDHKMMVPRGEKSGVPVEPLLSDQWFVKIEPLAKPAIEAVESGKIEFIPKQAENIYFAWMRDIRDWCISRQQWWGHRIPAWYDADGNIFVGTDEQAVREAAGLAPEVELSQDEDVLDTWFSSALWTFSTLGWPDQTKDLDTFHSTDIMVTGHDIISFWVSRMIMMSLRFTEQVPFKKVYIHGLVVDSEGQKMSKSKGNGLDPMDIIDGISAEQLVSKRTNNLLQQRVREKIEKSTRKEFPEGIDAYGTDALRFTFYAIATRTRSMRFDLKRVEGYRNFCNKLWNAANFVFMNTDDHNLSGARHDSIADQWIQITFDKTSRAVNLAMDTYRFDLAAKAIYEFIWDEFCDWYIELCKATLLSDRTSAEQKTSTRVQLLTTLEQILRLTHPFMPFITEEIWQKIPAQMRQHQTIMLAPYPVAGPKEDTPPSRQVTDDIDWLKQVIGAVRNTRGEMDISPARPIPLIFYKGSAEDRRRLDSYTELLTAIARPESLTWLNSEDTLPVANTQLIGEMQLLVPLENLIDKNAELQRLAKELDRLANDIKRSSGKLANKNFTNKAPADVVEKEKLKLADFEQALNELTLQRNKINDL